MRQEHGRKYKEGGKVHVWKMEHGEHCRVLFKIGVAKASLALSSLMSLAGRWQGPSFPRYEPLHSRQRTELREHSTAVCLKPEYLMLGALSPHGVSLLC